MGWYGTARDGKASDAGTCRSATRVCKLSHVSIHPLRNLSALDVFDAMWVEARMLLTSRRSWRSLENLGSAIPTSAESVETGGEVRPYLNAVRE